jgi:Mg2+-importing ATPase
MLGPLDAANNRELFQTGWFIESLFSQMLIVYVLRSQSMPWSAPRPSRALIITTCIILAIGLYVPVSAIGPDLGFVPLPTAYWGWLALILGAYLLCSLAAVRWLASRRQRS